jgi:hypothetical protein
MTLTTPSAGYSLSLRVRLASRPGARGALTTALVPPRWTSAIWSWPAEAIRR